MNSRKLVSKENKPFTQPFCL